MTTERLYGWFVNTSYSALTADEKLNNATIFASHFYWAKGWSPVAICAILGNIDTESHINPGTIEGDPYGQLEDNSVMVNYPGGVGLVQWTGAYNLVQYAIDENRDWYDGNLQKQRLEYEKDNGLEFVGQWVNGVYYDWNMTNMWQNVNVDDMTEAFCRGYLRPADPSGTLPNRKASAEYWLNHFDDIKGIPSTPIIKKKRKVFCIL